jgi:hypothetical protein
VNTGSKYVNVDPSGTTTKNAKLRASKVTACPKATVTSLSVARASR